MPQVHCYIPEDTAKQLQQRAQQARIPVSRYLAQLIRKDLASPWPEHYFELCGAWEGESLERPEQGNLEQRLEL